jgi:putative transposase
MGRLRRPYLPGAVFHLTARTLQRERLFTPEVRSGALLDLVRVAPLSKSRILAVAVMSNHLHLIVQQGEGPLQALMQPFLRRLARRTQRAHGRDGPVFWRHYSAVVCHDPWHARNAIVYTHLNPVRAGLAAEPSRYRWSSHDLYALSPEDGVGRGAERLAAVIDPSLALPLFGSTRDASTARLRADYRAFVEWRRSMDCLGVAADPTTDDSGLPERPAAAWASGPWGAALSPLFHTPVRQAPRDTGPGSHTPDMTTIARMVLAMDAPGVPLALIRGSGPGGRRRSQLRHAIARRLHAAGYRNKQIARFLNVSESTVSNAIRRRPAR